MTTPPRGIVLPAWKIKVIDKATQFRVVVKRRDGETPIDFHDGMFWFADGDSYSIDAPYQPGEVLFVEETFNVRIESVRCERLQDITEEDARAEGVSARIAGMDAHGPVKTFRTGFVYSWDSASKHKFADGEWVWVFGYNLVKS